MSQFRPKSHGVDRGKAEEERKRGAESDRPNDCPFSHCAVQQVSDTPMRENLSAEEEQSDWQKNSEGNITRLHCGRDAEASAAQRGKKTVNERYADEREPRNRPHDENAISACVPKISEGKEEDG